MISMPPAASSASAERSIKSVQPILMGNYAFFVGEKSLSPLTILGYPIR